MRPATSALALALALALLVPAHAGAQVDGIAGGVVEAPQAQQGPAPEPGPEPAPAKIEFRLKGLKHGKVTVGDRFTAIGTVAPFVAGQRVQVIVKRGNKTIKKKVSKVGRAGERGIGRFQIVTPRLIKPARYRVRAYKLPTQAQGKAFRATRSVGIKYPDLDPGDRSERVRLFNKLLGEQAYHGASGRGYGRGTSLAVMAFRKVNGMARTSNATPGIFRRLAAGRGGFKLKWPGGGKHVETDLSRQVMVLAKNGKAKHIFHISSGTAATPTIRGKMVFFRKEYGRNNKNMIHSVYFDYPGTHRGYATHGYASVPTYPASHGCLRNPVPYAKFIYDWIDLGDWIYVYP